jgi:pimeloyl-ACP methyl ester carboxylesterase
MERSGVERTLLLTESFGGGVSLQAALLAPERVRGIAIVNSFARYPERARLALSIAIAPLIRRPIFRAARRLFAERYLLHPRRDASVLAAFRSAAGMGMDAAYRCRLRMIRTLDLLPRLSDIHCPVAIYAADSDRIVASLQAGRELKERLPNASLEILHNANHLVLPLPEEPWEARLLALDERARCATA